MVLVADAGACLTTAQAAREGSSDTARNGLPLLPCVDLTREQKKETAPFRDVISYEAPNENLRLLLRSSRAIFGTKIGFWFRCTSGPRGLQAFKTQDQTRVGNCIPTHPIPRTEEGEKKKIPRLSFVLFRRPQW